MDKLITAEEAKILNEVSDSLNKIYKTLNRLIKEAALNGETETKYSILPYLYRNYKLIANILHDSLTEAGYRVRIAYSEGHSEGHSEGTNSTNKVTLHISWSDTTNGGDNIESETEE